MRNKTQYAIDIDASFGTYRYVMVDSTQEYGLKTLFSLYGEAKQSKLNHLESLISYGNASELNDTYFFAHHPLNEIPSEKSSSGKDYKTILRESGTPVYSVGHLHYEYLYKNHGEFTEIHAPAFKDEYHFRISAIDNGMYSFSDLTLHEGPYIVITNPTDARFYNDQMPLEQLETTNQLRALILSNQTITSAYATIDGEVVGNLTDADSNNLWTLDYDPTNFSSGFHDLKVFVESGGHSSVQSLTFNLEGKVKEYSPSSFVWIYFAWPVAEIFMGLAIAIVSIGLLRILLSQALSKKRGKDWKSSTLEEIEQNEPHKIKCHYQKRAHQQSNLPPWVQWLFFFTQILILLGPVMIGMFSEDKVGILIMGRVFIDDTYIYTNMFYIVALILAFATLSLQNFVIRTNKQKLNWISGLVFAFWILFFAIYLVFIGAYFGWYSIFMNPIVYLHILGLSYGFKILASSKQSN